MLDVGCCKGYYVLAAAARPACRRAVGIDINESFIRAAESARACLGLEESRAQFRVASIHDVAARVASYGGPFQTILLLGTYHYLYWGSETGPAGAGSHEAILRDLADVCCGHVLFSGRPEVADLPRHLRQRAISSGQAERYTLQAFCEAAGRQFEVRTVGHLGKYPLLDLVKREA